MTTPLPAASPSALMTMGSSWLCHIGLGRRGVGEAPIGGGRNAEFGAEILGEALGAFELGRRLGRPEHFDALRFEIVGEPGHQRRLGPDHHEADLLVLAEARDRAVIAHVERHALGDRRDAGIARRAIERVEQGALRELPGERMLASAAADQKHIHRALIPACSELVRRVRGLYALCDDQARS